MDVHTLHVRDMSMACFLPTAWPLLLPAVRCRPGCDVVKCMQGQHMQDTSKAPVAQP